MAVFETLNKINVNDNTDKKGNLTYLSWAWAWAEVKKQYPEATYKIERFENNAPYLKDENAGYMVFTKVTIDGLTHEMWLPVMDYKNKAMQVGQATMTDINKTIMRCLTKNLAMHGLGLYIYAGEDLPEDEKEVLELDLKPIGGKGTEQIIAELEMKTELKDKQAEIYKFILEKFNVKHTNVLLESQMQEAIGIIREYNL